MTRYTNPQFTLLTYSEVMSLWNNVNVTTTTTTTTTTVLRLNHHPTHLSVTCLAPSYCLLLSGPHSCNETAIKLQYNKVLLQTFVPLQ